MKLWQRVAFNSAHNISHRLSPTHTLTYYTQLCHLQSRHITNKKERTSLEPDDIDDGDATKSQYNTNVAIITHPSCLRHEFDGHPDSPQRLRVITDSLKNPEIALPFASNLTFLTTPSQTTRSQITIAHSQKHVDDILDKAEEASESGKTIKIDADTFISPHSVQAILFAVSSVTYAVDVVLNDNKDTNEHSNIARAFCAIRPPGHHAESDRSLGFCLFNNIFIGAKYAQLQMSKLFDIHNAKIAIIDFDCHHGNGTQAMAWNEQNILYISLHQFPFYPGTGAKDECGAFDNVLNIPLETGANGKDVRNAFVNQINAKLDKFQPNLVMISAGFDAHGKDEIASLDFVDEDYEWMTQQIVNIANLHSNGKVVSVLEGGYNLDALKTSVTAHVRALCE